MTKTDGIRLVEYGVGNLKRAEGMVVPDSVSYNSFEYYDFNIYILSYSVDVFPDGSKEWFATTWIPCSSLGGIFESQHNPQNQKLQELVSKSSVWKNISIIGFSVSFGLMFIPFLLSLGLPFVSQSVTYNQTKKLPTKTGSEILFEEINIPELNKVYKIQTRIALPKYQAVSIHLSFLNSAGNPISSSYNEHVNNTNANNIESVSTVFYPENNAKYKLLVTVKDYGNIGSGLVNSIPSSSLLPPPAALPFLQVSYYLPPRALPIPAYLACLHTQKR